MEFLKNFLWIISLPFVYLFLILKIFLTKNKARKYLKNPDDFLDDERYDAVYKLARIYLYTKKINLDYFAENKILLKPQLIISNHRSMMDAILIYVFLYKKTNLRPVFVAKQELQESFFGFALNLVDTIYIDRNNLRQMFNTIEQQKNILKNNKILVIFPEGTRNIEDELLEFKSGALEVAYKTMVPIQPLVIAHQEQYMEEKKKDKTKNKKPIIYKLLTPIQPSDFIHINRDILAKKIRNKMQEEYNNIK